MMSVDHSPSWFRRFTDQPLGFFTTAECFVFVSAFLAGMVFRRRSEKLGFAAARASSVHRALRIYRAHLLTVGFAFVLGSFFLSEFPGVRYLLDHYLLNPWTAIVGSLTLIFRPPLMDILPMYVLFSLLTPLAFWAAHRWGWRTVLVVSFLTWLVGQTHLRDLWLTTAGNLSFVQLGPFDLLAWQFLWVGGLFIGQRRLDNQPLLVIPRWLQPLLVLSVIAFLFCRWVSVASGSDPITQSWWFDKWHLGPLRLINFALAASVTATFLKYISRWEAGLRPFLLIGRHMLPVFCSQICLSLLLIGRTESGLTTEPITSALVICQLLSAPLFAWFLERQSTAARLARALPLSLAAEHRIALAEAHLNVHSLPSRSVPTSGVSPSVGRLVFSQSKDLSAGVIAHHNKL
jgi:hypothetical protein